MPDAVKKGRGVADWIRRLKAALTPQLVLLLLAALALIGYCTLRDQTGDETTRLEKQTSAVLSRMEGAGRAGGDDHDAENADGEFGPSIGQNG